MVRSYRGGAMHVPVAQILTRDRRFLFQNCGNPILEHAPDVNDLATLLAEAMQRPLMEQTRCRPKAFHLRDNPEWDELRPHLAQLRIEVVVTETLLKWEEVFADLIDYLKSGTWKQPVLDIAGDVEGGDKRQDRLLGLRLAVILYPAMRKANKTK
jgi:hypothetical protein